MFIALNYLENYVLHEATSQSSFTHTHIQYWGGKFKLKASYLSG